MAEPSKSSSFPAEETRTQKQDVTRNIAIANRYLANNEPKKALLEYTKILTDVSPGHPVAFLNRSLCYLISGFPQLAAIDAYRALLAAEAVKRCPGVIDQTVIAGLHDYTRNADPRFDTWIAEPHCYVGKQTLAFLDCDLASICVTPQRRTGINILLVNSDVRTLNQLLMDMKLKARYRLALSLWKCGGGSKQSALTECIAAQRLPFASIRDKNQFEKLSDHILFDVQGEFEEEKEVHRRLRERGQIAEEVGYGEDAGLRSLMKTEFTTVNRELYDWDYHSISVMHETQDALLEINRHKDGFANVACELQLQDGDHPNTVLSLVAEHDLAPFKQILGETSYVHAVFPSILTHCDTCGSGVTFPPGGREAAMATARAVKIDLLARKTDTSGQLRPQEDSAAASDPNEYDSDTTILVEDDIMDDEIRSNDADGYLTDDGMDYDDDYSSDGSRDIPFDSDYARYEGLQFCPFCLEAIYCSKDCADVGAQLVHRHLCGSSKQEADYTIPSPDTFDLPSNAATSLVRQVMQRVIANILSSSPSETQHELDQIWIRMLCCDLEPPREVPRDSAFIDLWNGEKGAPVAELFPQRLNMSSSSKGKEKAQGPDTPTNLLPIKRIPWSFQTNVLDPLTTLFHAGSKLDISYGYMAALDCKRFDGWVLETIRFRIHSSMRITRFPRTIKQYNADLSYRTHTDYPLPIIHDRIGDRDQQGRNIWMASLHVRTAGIREAINDQGEQSNVQIGFSEGRAGVWTTRAVSKGEILLY